MRKIVVAEFMSLDGVMQAPGGADEDTEGGFTHGGWTWPYWHDDLGAHFDAAMRETDAMLLGRKTWQGHGAAFEPMPEGDPFGEAVFAGAHRLNGNGELTGLEWVRESGRLTSPIAITNTSSVGVVRDALVAAAARQPTAWVWALPVVGETWDGWLNDTDFHFEGAEVVATFERRKDASPTMKALLARDCAAACSPRPRQSSRAGRWSSGRSCRRGGSTRRRRA